ncbi:hypothetical protein PAECIP111891_03602 [Paenibacillus allorhizoplanae]|uniref:Uncharacterized protein n=1 Tax=Paenibacillus allorhizoplanae TaxID=2905648 RepID=A0ABM9CGE8_9BACL|nr:hypothetical protein [Paenibacillus allorhizoplanae]CAH1210833.1 hypothetical protein PAECIP111891_03602 [Paenibacillus allorhizoplanae]
MKKGWFELDKFKHDDCYCYDCPDCLKTWKIHIYAYEANDDSAPDVTLILNKSTESGSGYYVMEYSITYVGRAIMFDEATAMIKKLDEISSTNDAMGLTDHLIICREFFDCGKMIS